MTHLSYIEQIKLEKEAQGTSCHLIGCAADCIADLAPDRQPMLMLGGKKRGNKKKLDQNVLTLSTECSCRKLLQEKLFIKSFQSHRLTLSSFSRAKLVVSGGVKYVEKTTATETYSSISEAFFSNSV